MTVNLIVVIAHRANLAQHLHASAKLFLQLPMNRLFGGLANFDATASCFDKSSVTEYIVSNDTDKVEKSFLVHNDGPSNMPIMRNLRLLPSSPTAYLLMLMLIPSLPNSLSTVFLYVNIINNTNSTSNPAPKVNTILPTRIASASV